MASEEAKPVFKREREEFNRLWRPVRSLADVVALYQSLCGEAEKKVWEKFRKNLEAALEKAGLASEVGALFQSILKWADQALETGTDKSFPQEVTIWTPGSGQRRVEYTALQCRGLLANALLLNVNDTTAHLKEQGHTGGLDFSALLHDSKPWSHSRVACLLTYFKLHLDEERGGEVERRTLVWERRSIEMLDASATPEEEEREGLAYFFEFVGRAKSCEPVSTFRVTLHDKFMEDIEDADSLVDFADSTFSMGRIGTSCTQEEVLQVCCPEFNVAMLHMGLLRPGEVAVTRHARRFSEHTGFGADFECAGAWRRRPREQSILTMDAVREEHFSFEANLRDIRKAYLCFSGCGSVSTGRWGCGVFGGSPAQKFVQQVIAARLAGCSLSFSNLALNNQPDEVCGQILELLQEKQPSIGELLTALLEITEEHRQAASFLQALRGALDGGLMRRPSRPEEPRE